MQECRNYCSTLYELVNPGSRGFWDKENAKFCSVCGRHFFTPMMKCECCKTILRSNPRSRLSKERLLR